MVVGSPIVLNLIPGGVMPVIMINETDKGYQKEFLIYNGNTPYNVPANVSATIRGTKRDGYGVTEAADVTAGSNVVRITVTEQMTAVPGKNIFELVFVDTNSLRVATANFIMLVERSALNANTVISDSDIAYSEQVLNQLQGVAAFKEQLDNQEIAKIQRYDTVAQMQADADLKAGMYARTGGYYAVNDGGGALYRIDSTAPETHYESLSSGLFARLIHNQYIVPEWFGAHGDGTTDDTTSIINALKYSIEHKTQLVLQKKYYVTRTLLSNDYATSVTLNIKGVRPYKYMTRYSGDRNSNGSLIVSQGVNLFTGLTVYGSIETIGVLTNVSTEEGAYTSGSVFSGCKMRGFSFVGCAVSRIGSFCINTEWWSCSLIKDNHFLNIFEFAKCTVECHFGDSVIEGNYINGGRLKTNHSCFGFFSYNGSVVRGNFIDYYRIIYDPYRTQSNSADLPLSIGNEYQVFLYLYNAHFYTSVMTSVPVLNGVFVGDVINWTDPEVSDSNGYNRLSYTGHDNNSYTVPECIIWARTRGSLVFDNIVIEANVGNIVFIDNTINDYSTQHFRTLISGQFSQDDAKASVRQGGFFTGGQYRYRTFDLPFIDTVDSLPSVSLWDTSGNYAGRKVLCNGLLYRLIYNMSTSAWEWVQINSIN